MLNFSPYGTTIAGGRYTDYIKSMSTTTGYNVPTTYVNTTNGETPKY